MARKATKVQEAQPSFFNQPPKVLERDESVPSKWDRAVKEHGEKVFSERDWEAPGKLGIVPARSLFIECNDGFYAIVLPSQEFTHYRVAKKIIHGIINKTTNENESTNQPTTGVN